MSGVSLATGHWQDVVERNRRPVKPLLRTMSENPALEWNTNIQTGETEASEVVMVPLVHGCSVKLMFAPAIVHQKLVNHKYSEILVAGISSEVNFMSDINICISLQQLTFMLNLQSQIQSFFKTESQSKEKTQKQSDSGLESIREDESFKSVDNSSHESVLVPIEGLLTCTNVRLALHKYEKSSASVTAEDVRLWRRYHHAHRGEANTKLEASVSEDSDDDPEERNVLLEADTHPASEKMSTTGYEGSEDESTAETVTEVKIRLIPLTSVCLTQPYISVSLGPAHQRMELSVYNMSVALAPLGFHLPARSGKKVPWHRDFPLLLFETRPGRPDPNRGIHPGLVTACVTDLLSKSPSLMASVKRPVMLSLSEERFTQLKQLRDDMAAYTSGEGVTCVPEERQNQKMLLFKEICLETSQIMCKYDFKHNSFQHLIKAALGEFRAKATFDVFYEIKLYSLQNLY